MQEKNLQHRKIHIAALPIINYFLCKLGCKKCLEKNMGNKRYAAAIEVLIKNILLEHSALYRIPRWAKFFDPKDIGMLNLTDDVIGRALDKLFFSQRATIQTELTMNAVKLFNIDVSQIHNDSTSVKFYGTYKSQCRKAVQLKRGHSKDHRPDLKQLLYNLSISRDGAIPIHFKVHDGNHTDDQLHIETWLTLRGMLGATDFLYVADSKLCTSENMKTIDRNQGKFITIVPETRSETKEFADRCFSSLVRWKQILRKPSTRKKSIFDVFQTTDEFYQLSEGFRLYWYRSSEKKRRDKESREERIATAINRLEEINQKQSRGRRTVNSVQKRAENIVEKLNVSKFFNITIEEREEESFIKLSRGKQSSKSTYRRIVKHIPVLVFNKNNENIARDASMDGVFPLTTNTTLNAKEVLEAYKYQPHIEKRFSGIKSDHCVSPVFLKKNERIEALMFAFYMADLVAALIQRELKHTMDQKGIEYMFTLPEERPSKTPTWEQVQRLFAQFSKYELSDGKRIIRTFWDQLSEPQKQILELLPVVKRDYCPTI